MNSTTGCVTVLPFQTTSHLQSLRSEVSITEWAGVIKDSSQKESICYLLFGPGKISSILKANLYRLTIERC